MQVSTPIIWLVIVPLRCSRTLKEVGGAHPELYFPIRREPTSLPSSQLPITAVEGGGLSRIHYLVDPIIYASKLKAVAST